MPTSPRFPSPQLKEGHEMIEGWKETKIADAAEFTRKPRDLDMASFEQVPFVPMDLVSRNNTFVQGCVWKPGKDIRSGNYFEKGDCLLAKITPCFENGKQGIARDLPADFGFASTELIPFRGRSGISNKFFLFHFFLDATTRRQISQKMEGATGRQRIPISVLKNWPISLPPIPEQKKIAAVLLKIQRAIETQDKIISALRDLKKSTMQHLFTHGLRGETWNEILFGNFATLHRGYDLPVQSRSAGIVPIVGSNGIVGYHNEAKISGPGVVTGRSGSIGISYYIEAAFWPLNTGLYVSDFHGNSPLFVHYFFDWFDFTRYAAGVSVPTLNRNIVHKASIRVPDVKVQKEIAANLGALDVTFGHHQSQKAALQDLFKTTLNKLMTGNIRVGDLDIDVKEVAI